MILSSVIPFCCLQSLPASRSFPVSQLFALGGQSIGVSASTSVQHQSNEHPGVISFRMNWLDLLAVQGTQESSPAPQFKSINSLALSFLSSPTLIPIYDYWKIHSLTIWTFVSKVISLLSNTLSSFVIAFLQGASIF